MYAADKSLQLCPTLCDPTDSSPPGFPVPGILQARTLEWVAIFFSSAWKWKVKVKDPLEKGMATHSSILAWRISRIPDRLQSIGSQSVWHDWSNLACTRMHTLMKKIVIELLALILQYGFIETKSLSNARPPNNWIHFAFSSVQSLNHVWLLVTPWTAAYQAPPSMGFSRQEYWSRVPLPSLDNNV